MAHEPSVIALIPAALGVETHPGQKCSSPARASLNCLYDCRRSRQWYFFGHHHLDRFRRVQRRLPSIMARASLSCDPPSSQGISHRTSNGSSYTLKRLHDEGQRFDCFSILRPTSPFRQPETIRRAWKLFSNAEGVDSLRAVEKAKQHPGKMWVVRGERMTPLLP